MKKIIVLLFLGISFVGMILISYMKYQTTLFIDHSPAISNSLEEYQIPYKAEKVWFPGL